MLETITALVGRGYTSQTKADMARNVCGKVFEVDGRRCAILAVDVRCDWFEVVFENGDKGECHFHDLHIAGSGSRYFAPAHLQADTDYGGEFAVTRHVYASGYSEVLRALGVGKEEMVA